MPILIAHRGNTEGPSKEENKPEHITKALAAGFDAECDVWYKDGQWMLGHNYPQYPVSYNFLKYYGLWIHCKNIEALEKLTFDDCNCFWHQRDEYTLTSSGYIWIFPGKPIPESNGIVVLKQKNDIVPSLVVGVCSDWVAQYK